MPGLGGSVGSHARSFDVGSGPGSSPRGVATGFCLHGYGHQCITGMIDKRYVIRTIETVFGERPVAHLGLVIGRGLKAGRVGLWRPRC